MHFGALFTEEYSNFLASFVPILPTKRFLANVNSRSRSLYAVVRPSVVYLSVTFVRPIQPVEIFGNVSTPFDTLVIRRQPGKILRRSFQGNPSIGVVKRKRGSQI